MKVILLEDVKKIGKKGDIVSVSDGYGSNFLIPNKKAVLATKTSLKIKGEEEEKDKRKKEEKRKQAEKLKLKLDEITLIIKVGVGKEGKLFGAVSSKMIADEYKKQHNIIIDKRKMIDTHTINSLGYCKIGIELYKGVVGTLNIQVVEK